MSGISVRSIIPGVLATVVALGTAVITIPSAGAGSSSADEPVTVTFEAGSASLVPRADGSIRLVVDGLEDDARIDAPDAPKDAHALSMLEADADGQIEARLAADRGPKGTKDLDLVLTDVQYEGEGSFSATATLADNEDPTAVDPEGTAEGVTLTTEIDRPSQDDPTTTTTAPTDVTPPVPGAATSGSGYVITMPWQTSKYKQMTEWIFEPDLGSRQCVNNERATAPLTLVNPTGGRGFPVASIDFALVVNNDGDCFWQQSSMEFWVRTGPDKFKAGACKYKVKQIGPRTFTASAIEQSQNTNSCDATGGVNIVSGHLSGKERD